MRLAPLRLPGLRLSAAAILAAFTLSLATATPATAAPAAGKLVKYEAFASKHLDARNITVWLPPGYEEGTKRYAVLYMHDGQNLFEAETSYGGQEWGIDEAMIKLTAEGRIKDAIVVGMWNTSKRYLEYYPQAAFETLPAAIRTEFQQKTKGTPVSDAYLKFVTEELKPFIDKTYRTLPDRENTVLMGSSMGGLITTYAMMRHSKTFSAGAAVSTHWPMGRPNELSPGLSEQMFAAMLTQVEKGLTPDKGRIYFDFGTVNLDSYYEPLQTRVDAVMVKNGWTKGQRWDTRKFDGADHNEVSWRERVHIPILFLLGNGK